MITKVLVTVMTYPTLSTKHIETVCTAGFREDGTWVRIYPIPVRLIDSEKKIRKWHWIEVNLEHKDSQDNRPESYHICDISSLKILGTLDIHGKPNWLERLQWVLRNKRIYDNMDELIIQTKQNKVSLAVLKPTEVLDMTYQRINLDDNYYKKLNLAKEQYQAFSSQLSLFGDNDIRQHFEFAEKIPYRFKYKFKTADNKVRNIMVEDWEIGMLYRNCLKKDGETTACQKVRERYMQLAKEKDLYFFMGTSFEWQRRNANDPYLIIGCFYPPKHTADAKQLTLF